MGKMTTHLDLQRAHSSRRCIGSLCISVVTSNVDAEATLHVYCIRCVPDSIRLMCHHVSTFVYTYELSLRPVCTRTSACGPRKGRIRDRMPGCALKRIRLCITQSRAHITRSTLFVFTRAANGANCGAFHEKEDALLLQRQEELH